MYVYQMRSLCNGILKYNTKEEHANGSEIYEMHKLFQSRNLKGYFGRPRHRWEDTDYKEDHEGVD
jgi:IS30 family transposase